MGLVDEPAGGIRRSNAENDEALGEPQYTLCFFRKSDKQLLLERRSFVNESDYSYIQFAHAQQPLGTKNHIKQKIVLRFLFLFVAKSKDSAADALQVSAIGIQLARPRSKVVREQDETVGVQRASDIDLLDRRL